MKSLISKDQIQLFCNAEVNIIICCCNCEETRGEVRAMQHTNRSESCCCVWHGGLHVSVLGPLCLYGMSMSILHFPKILLQWWLVVILGGWVNKCIIPINGSRCNNSSITSEMPSCSNNTVYLVTASALQQRCREVPTRTTTCQKSLFVRLSRSLSKIKQFDNHSKNNSHYIETGNI